MFKFLAAGRIGPLSRVAWPAPGQWLVTAEPLRVGRHGAHVCRAEDLAHWLHDELWQIEVAGDRLAAPDCVVVERARLIERVDAWDAAQFAAACIAHARAITDGPYLSDAVECLRHGYAAIAAYNAALAIAGGDEAAYAAARAWQSAWIVRELL
ncbi:MAG: hypothetical protein ABIY55_24510 [Kofleriaceae bacterium]